MNSFLLCKRVVFCCPESSKLEFPVENFQPHQPRLHRHKWGLKLKLKFRSRTTAPSLLFPSCAYVNLTALHFPRPGRSPLFFCLSLSFLSGVCQPLIPKQSFPTPQTPNTSSTSCSYSTSMNCHVHSSLFIMFYFMSCSCLDSCCHNFVVAIFSLHSVDFMLNGSLFASMRSEPTYAVSFFKCPDLM